MNKKQRVRTTTIARNVGHSVETMTSGLVCIRRVYMARLKGKRPTKKFARNSAPRGRRPCFVYTCNLYAGIAQFDDRTNPVVFACNADRRTE